MADEVTPIAEAAQSEAQTEPVSASSETETPVIETQTAQMGGNEPLGSEPEPIDEAKPTNSETPKQTETQSPSVQVVPRNGMRELLAKAQSAIQFRKRKKLDKVMSLFAKRTSITNDEVEKLLHVSDATATRYLSILEKENKIKQSGKTGKSVSYTKI
jgi:predicted HTH transcriptional regulator